MYFNNEATNSQTGSVIGSLFQMPMQNTQLHTNTMATTTANSTPYTMNRTSSHVSSSGYSRRMSSTNLNNSSSNTNQYLSTHGSTCYTQVPTVPPPPPPGPLYNGYYGCDIKLSAVNSTSGIASNALTTSASLLHIKNKAAQSHQITEANKFSTFKSCKSRPATQETNAFAQNKIFPNGGVNTASTHNFSQLRRLGMH